MVEAIVSFLYSDNALLVLTVLADIILSFLQFRKTSQIDKKTVSTTQKVVDSDINALINYHEKAINQLKKKGGE